MTQKKKIMDISFIESFSFPSLLGEGLGVGYDNE